MKILLPALAAALFASPLPAAILPVDNNPGSVAQYKTFAAAYTAAADGDTIILAGSGNDYGSHTLNKRLTIIGPGYLLSENRIPGLAFTHARINLTVANTAVGNASGSRFDGLLLRLATEDDTTGVIVERCTSDTDWDCDGRVTIRLSMPNIVYMAMTGSTIRNCIVKGRIILSNGTQADHCTILGDAGGDDLTSLSNCILTAQAPLFGFRGSISHCLATQGSLPSGSGNISGPLILDNVVVNTGSADAKWTLKAGSPAIGAGTDGTDMGAFGGPSPYKLSGVPPVPRLTRLVVPPSATNTSGLRFEVDARAFGE